MIVRYADAALEVFIAALTPPTRAKVLRTIDLLERFGHQLGMPHSKQVARRLFELRTRGRQDVRIFYTFRKNTDAVLLHGFVKKSTKIPAKELAIAKRKLATVDRI